MDKDDYVCEVCGHSYTSEDPALDNGLCPDCEEAEEDEDMEDSCDMECVGCPKKALCGKEGSQ